MSGTDVTIAQEGTDRWLLPLALWGGGGGGSSHEGKGRACWKMPSRMWEAKVASKRKQALGFEKAFRSPAGR